MPKLNFTSEKKPAELSSLYGAHKNSVDNSGQERDDLNIESTEEVLKDLDKFLSAHATTVVNKQANNNGKVFFQINGANIYGEKNKRLSSDDIPLFKGATLDINQANIVGIKKFFKDPEASGSGGLVTVFPDELSTALIFPMKTLNLKEDYAAGESQGDINIGFGTFNRIVASSLVLNNNSIVLKDGALLNNAQNVSAGVGQNVPIGDIIVDAGGLRNKALSKEAMYAFLNFDPKDYPAPVVEKEEAPPANIDPAVIDEIVDSPENPDTPAVVEHVEDPPSTAKIIENIEENSDTPEENGDVATNEETEEEAEDEDENILQSILSDIKDAGIEFAEEQLDTIKENIKAGKFNLKETHEAIKNGGLEAINTFLEDNDITVDKFKEAIDGAYDFASEIESEVEASEDKDSVKAGVEAALSIPIFPPLLNFRVGASAEVSAGYSVDAGPAKIPQIDFAERKITDNKDMAFKLAGKAEAAGSVGLSIGVELGVANIVGIEAALQAALEATVNTEIDIFAEFGTKGVRPTLNAITMSGNLDAELSAILDAVVSLNILVWSQDLYTKNIASMSLGKIDGAVEARKGFGTTDSAWSFDSNFSGGFMNNAYGFGRDKAELQKLLGVSGNPSHTFQQNAESFENIKKDLQKAQEIAKAYSASSKGNVVIADPTGPEKLMILVQEIEDKFYLQYESANKNISKCLIQLQTLKTNKEYIAVKNKNDTLGEYKKTLDIARDLITSDNEASQNIGKAMVDKLKVQMKDDKVITTNINDTAAKAAVTELKDVNTLLLYEQRRTSTLSKRYRETKSEMATKAGDLHLEHDQQSAELYNLYQKDQDKKQNFILGHENHLKKHFIQEVANKQELLMHFMSLQKKSGKSGVETHTKRINKMQDLYNKISEDEKDVANESFYNAYKDVDGTLSVAPTGVFKTQYETADKEQLKAFTAEYAQKQGILKLLNDKSAYEKLIGDQKSAKEKSDAGGEETAAKALTEYKDLAMKDFQKNKHMFATNNDFMQSRQKIAMVDKLVSNKRDKSDGLDEVSVLSQIRDKLSLDKNAVNKLIAFEKTREKPDDKIIKTLESFTEEIAGKKAQTKKGKEPDLDERIEKTKERNTLSKRATDYYFENLSNGTYKFRSTNKISDAVRNNYDIGAFYSNEELAGIEYDGQGKDEGLSVSEQRKMFGAKDSSGKIDNDANNRAISSTMDNNLTDDRMISYFDFKAREKNNSLVNMYNLARGSGTYTDIIVELKKPENAKTLESYSDYFKAHAKTLLTPRQIMNHEMSREEVYENTNKAQIDMIKSGEYDKLAEDEIAKKFASQKIDDKKNTISMDQINSIEDCEQSVALEKHTKRIEALQSEEGAASYTGTRFEIAKSAVQSRKESMLKDPKELSNILDTVIETDKEKNDEKFLVYQKGADDLQKTFENLVEQQTVCKKISDKASLLIKSPQSLITDTGAIDNNLIDEITKTEKGTTGLETLNTDVATIDENLTQAIAAVSVESSEETDQDAEDEISKEIIKGIEGL